MASQKATQAIGIGVGLVGLVFLIHKGRQWWIRRELDQLRDKAARGEVPTRDFLDAVLKSGQPVPEAGGVVVSAKVAQRLQCTDVFPASLISSLPEFAMALDQLRREGTCL